jgi:adenosylcobinamide-GDP ribazoletransferase
VWLLLGGLLPLLLAGLLARRCVRRLGGVTGDVLGACVEVAFTASLLMGTFG